MPDSRYRERVRAVAYPVREAAGLVWGYFGPPGRQPPFPQYPWLSLPPGSFPVNHLVYRANWVQFLEGLVDSSHVGILHSDEMNEARQGRYDTNSAARDRFPTADHAPVLEVENTTFGFHYAAIRAAQGRPDHRYVRVTPYILPFMVYVPPGDIASMFVPVDDETTAQYAFPTTPQDMSPQAVAQARRFVGYGPDIVDAEHRFRLPEQDRAAMAAGRSFTGYRGLVVQDAAVVLSMGPVFDRSREHVVPADMAVLRLRRLLIASARQVAAGGDPIGLDRPLDTAKIEGAAGVIHRDTPWQSLVPGNVAVERQ